MKWRLDQGQIEVVDDAMAAIYRSKTPAERVANACQANRTARLILAARIQSLHPDGTEIDVNQEVARRFTRGTG